MAITAKGVAAVIAMLLVGASAQACQFASRSGRAAHARTPFAPPIADPDHDHDVDLRADCTAPSQPGQAACFAMMITDMDTYDGPDPAGARFGLSPAGLQRAYGLDASRGSGQTVAIVDAYDDPRAESDLAIYRGTYGLPGCTTANGCFRKVSENGGTSYPKASSDWAGEISLDLDMVSAICPKCHILLAEASSGGISDLGAAVNTAVRLGAKFVSNSYGLDESPADTAYDRLYFNHPGVVITAAVGDGGYATSYPAASRYVTAVGGTTLKPSSKTARGYTETVWGHPGSVGTGSGCSSYDAKPVWQTDAGCSRRTDTDVSAVADPDTGVAVYDGRWVVNGGTSAASPIIAATYALAGTPAAATYPSSYPYAHPAALHNVTSGDNGSCSPSYLCTARAGYNGPTGLGTPNGDAAFAAPRTGAMKPASAVMVNRWPAVRRCRLPPGRHGCGNQAPRLTHAVTPCRSGSAGSS